MVKNTRAWQFSTFILPISEGDISYCVPFIENIRGMCSPAPGIDAHEQERRVLDFLVTSNNP